MKILIFDTETSGLYPGFNVILQLSYQIVDSDTWYSDKVVNHYFPWPDNKYRVSEEAICVNGLSEEFLATQQLSDRKTALEEFVADKDACDLLVAHNIEFDKGNRIHHKLENPIFHNSSFFRKHIFHTLHYEDYIDMDYNYMDYIDMGDKHKQIPKQNNSLHYQHYQ